MRTLKPPLRIGFPGECEREMANGSEDIYFWLCVGTNANIADLLTFGRSAGAIRNRDMLDTGKPDLVVAFSGGRGTADMVRRAGKAGVAVNRPGSRPV